MHLVDACARRLAESLPPCFDFEELRSVGYLGLIDAASKFDSDRQEAGYKQPVPFNVYARHRIRGAMLDSVRRRHYAEAFHLPIDYTQEYADKYLPGLVNDTAAKAEGVAAAEDPAIEEGLYRREAAQLVREAIGRLPVREIVLIEAYYRRGMDFEGAGRALGVGPSRAGQIHRKALAALRRDLQAHGLRHAAI